MKNILFVCIENSCRSQMAEGFFNHLAQGKAKAFSAGTQPSKEVNPLAIRVMKEVGVDISNQRPKLLTEEQIKNADRVVVMGCGADVGAVCPAVVLERVENWDIEDPKGKPIEKFREVRDIIREKIESLVKEIEKQN
ncbi:MAG: low molecular weight phosphatase family protein [Candidatus Margulisiibacteriota bacterium]